MIQRVSPIIRGEPVPSDTIPRWSAESETLMNEVAARLRDAVRARAPDTATPPGRRVVCIMMQRDEGELLDCWLRYHAWLFGPGNLIVLDNGSMLDSVRDRLHRAAAEGVHVIWDFHQKEHFEHKGRLFCGLMRAIEADLPHDFFMPLDCDEFIAVRDPDGRIDCSREGVERHLRQHRQDPGVLYIAGSFFNIPTQHATYYFQYESKCFFAARAVKTMHMGFHHGTARRSEQRVDTSVVHFHYRFKPYDLYIEAARRKLEARIPDFDPAIVADATRTRNWHLARYAVMSAEEYTKSFVTRTDKMPIDSLMRRLDALGSPLPF